MHVVCLESRTQMPADEIEVTEGAEEGLVLHNSRGPQSRLLADDGKVAGLRTVECTAVFDATGRFNPTFNEGNVEDIPADTIIFSIGQSSDLSFLQPGDGVESNRGLIKVDPETYQTTAPDVFACGDIAHGPRLFINAIRSAQIAARSMHDYLRGTRTRRDDSFLLVAGVLHHARRLGQAAPRSSARGGSGDARIVASGYRRRVFPKMLPAPKPRAACAAMSIPSSILDICVACTGCVDVCPENLIRLTGLAELCRTTEGRDWVASVLAMTPAELDNYSKAATRRPGRRDAERRNHLHPLRALRRPLPVACHHHAAVRLSPHVRQLRGSKPQIEIRAQILTRGGARPSQLEEPGPAKAMTPSDFSLVLAFGFVSSLHCVQMCGPIVLTYSVAANTGAARRSLLGAASGL